MGMDRYCFYASSRLYYFDEYHNVYSEDNTRISNGSLNLQLDDLLTPNFHIDGVPYWFDLDGLLYQNVDGTMNRVHVWHSDPESFNLGPMFDPSTFQPMFLPTFQNDMTSFVPEATPELAYGSSPSPPVTQISDFNSPQTENEVVSPSNYQPPRRAFQGSDLPWSPSSSTKSPIVTTASRESSVGPSLFPDAQYGHNTATPIAEEAPLFPDVQVDLLSGTQVVAKWHQEVAKAQKDAETTRPVKKASKDERRRCPICSKMFRRPSSLDDHLNVHSNDRPHMCPFKGCCTSFATKSNMKRHFLTHLVGPLEHYRPGPASSEIPRANTTKSGKVTRAPTTTYNSRAPHRNNGYFHPTHPPSSPAIPWVYGRSKQSKAGYNHLITSDDVKLFWPGSCAINLSVFIPTPFCIDETVYWFDMDVLWCQTPGHAAYPVHTWQNDPSEKLADKKHYFRTPSSLYYFDHLWNVFSVATPTENKGSTDCGHADQPKAGNSHSTTPGDLKLFWPNSAGIDPAGVIPMTFSIGGGVYWFDKDDLWCQAPGDRSYRVHTWQADPNESIPGRKHHFRTPSGEYYFDYRRNVFSHDGTLFCASSSAIDVGGLLPMTFSIGGTVYWFDVDVLWRQAPGDKCYRVHTWQGEPNETLKLADRKHHFYVSNILYYLDGEHHNLYSEDSKLVRKSSSSLATDELGIPRFQIGDAPFWLHKDGLISRSTGNALSRVLSWPKDSCASDAKSDSLQTGPLPWSPGSSPPPAGPVADSSQTRSTAPLFPKPSSTQSPPIGPARDIDPEKAQVQPARKRGNKDHVKCSYCEKVCRRPIALKERIRAHEKDKSEVCPFKDPNTGIACDTGYCTKLNMCRHFSTHRAGTLEEYLGLPSLSPRKKRENLALGFDAPYNPYHTGTTRH
ncbi:Zinc finger protein 574 [Rattus norvegicus] [Rhizoctonia solani]|uniref:Zinc finger protein 574 [Rattus norvegicus] n=1 Tax=Rhizoctonia solani TaxID=456999 RepID=A0A0K6G8C9_9AGAM|nr:Zinc finger protein 574 [Rattus norvegicus] [Rhizoctonia solani]